MNVTVLAKFVPNPTGTPQLGPDNLLVRDAGDGALDPGDEYGLELALQLVEAGGGEVTVVSMGPAEALAGVQRGARDGRAPRRAGLRPGAARRRRAGRPPGSWRPPSARSPYDLVLAGAESTDGYTGTMPATLAELLGSRASPRSRKLESDGDAFRVERQTEAGYDVVDRADAGADHRDRRRHRAALPEPQGDHGREVEAGRHGERRRPRRRRDLAATQTVAAVTDAPAKAGGEIVTGDEAVVRIADLLADAKVI